MRLTHTRLLVDDFDVSMRFFRDTLALGVALEVEGVYAEFETGEATLAIYNRSLMVDAVGPQVVGEGADGLAVTMAVEGVDETNKELNDRGLNFVSRPHDQEAWVLRVAHFRDPDGHLFEIYEPLKSASLSAAGS